MMFKNELLVHVGEAFSRDSLSTISGRIIVKYLTVNTVNSFIMNISVMSQPEQIKEHTAILQAQTDCKARLFCLNLCLFRSRHPLMFSRTFKKNAGFHIMRQCKWSWFLHVEYFPLSAQKKSSSKLLCSLYVMFKPPKSVRHGPSAVLCVPRLSLCSQSFVCLMTSLRGLLALDSKSQNEELPCSHVFKGAPSRYMTGNFLP